MTSSKRVAFIGLGAMGYPMAGHLARAGHVVTVFNRTRTRAQEWQNTFDGQIASTPAEAAADQHAVMICVGNDDDVRQVTTGPNGLLKTLPKGALLIDHTTTSETLAISLSAAAAQSGVAFLDAPVSGGQIGAERGALTVMIGGDEAALQRSATVDRVLCEKYPPNGQNRDRTAYQNGQPNLHRWAPSRIIGGDPFR